MTTISFFLLWSLLPATTLLLALFLLRAALRGRRLDDHPLCRRCGYDLVGAAADSPLCPECGADTRRPRATRIGHRAQKPATLLVAILLLSTSAAGLFLTGRRAAFALSDDANQPTWWLNRRLAHNSARDRDAAFAELNRRLRIGRLSLTQIDATAERLLALQADPAVTWDPTWGDFLHYARQLLLLSDTHWQQFARQGVVLTLQTRPITRRVDRLPLRIDIGPSRVGAQSLFSFEARLHGLAVDGRPLDGIPVFEHFDEISSKPWSAVTRSFSLEPALLQHLADGPHRLAATFDIAVYETRVRPRSGPQLARFSLTRTVDITLVPSNGENVTLLLGRPEQAAVQRQTRIVSVERLGQQVCVTFDVQPLPFDLAADVVLRAGDREWPGDPITLQSGKGERVAAVVRVDDTFTADRVDVILRGTAHAARNSPKMTLIWGGELRFPDQPIQWLDKSHR